MEATDTNKKTDFQLLADISELEPHGQLSKWIGDHDILLYKHEGQIKAVSNICPHFGGPVGFRKAKDGVFTCLWHNWEYSCADGSCKTHPGLPLRQYELKQEGSKIYVNLLG
jgi:nitrite reductase/ring-hydroxylating ferredoxin subunit